MSRDTKDHFILLWSHRLEILHYNMTDIFCEVNPNQLDYKHCIGTQQFVFSCIYIPLAYKCKSKKILLTERLGIMPHVALFLCKVYKCSLKLNLNLQLNLHPWANKISNTPLQINIKIEKKERKVVPLLFFQKCYSNLTCIIMLAWDLLL